MSKIIKAYYSSDLSDDLYTEVFYKSLSELTNRIDLIDELLWTNFGRYRNLIHKYRKCHIYTLSDDRMLNIYSIKSNKRNSAPVLDVSYRFPENCRCFYFCRHRRSDHINISEYALLEELKKRYPNDDEFYFYKIFLDYLYDLNYFFNNDLDPRTESERQKTLEIPLDNPERAYWEYSKRFLHESYYVSQNGIRAEAEMFCNDPLFKGYRDFMIPERVKEMKRCKYPILWDTDKVHQINDYGQITEED